MDPELVVGLVGMVESTAGLAYKFIEDKKEVKLKDYTLVLEAKKFEEPTQGGGIPNYFAVSTKESEPQYITPDSRGEIFAFEVTLGKEGKAVEGREIRLTVAGEDDINIYDEKEQTNDMGKAYFHCTFPKVGKYKAQASTRLPGIL